MRTAAGFLQRDDGPAVAVFDTTGWDTHFNEGGAQGQLARAWRRSIRACARSRNLWAHAGHAPRCCSPPNSAAPRRPTARAAPITARPAAAFLLGGAVAGGRVLPTGRACRHAICTSSRDLKPTLDLRSVIKCVLHDHLQIASARSDRDVFPDSSGAPYIAGLLRGYEA